MKLLVTGASGLLGTRLCELAIKKNYKVYSAYSQHKPLHGTPFELDIIDRKADEEIFMKIKPEVVVHAAALSDVDKCEKEKDLAWKVNAEATAEMARLCVRHDAFLVYVSTDYVFNGEKGSYKETDKTAPVNHYGFTKLKGEEFVKESNAEYCIARSSVIYGAIPAGGKTNFALWLMGKLKAKEEARIAIDQWNSPTLNTNLAEMILEIVERKITGTFHLAGATRLSRYEFAKSIAGEFSLDTSFMKQVSSEAIQWVAKRPKDSSLRVDKASRILKRKPMKMSEALGKMKEEIMA